MELRSILESTQVGDLPVSTSPVLAPTDTVAEAARQMRNASHGSALICENGRLVGIFTERDLLRCIGTGQGLETKLADAMTAQPRTVKPGSSLFAAVREMDEGGCRRLPVVDATGAPVSVVDTKSVVGCLVEHFAAAVYNQASHRESIARRPEGA